MKCPFCSDDNTVVKDSRPTEDNAAIRRRRYCNQCDSRYTTIERVQLREITIVKKNGVKKNFDREKVLRAINTAVRKRSISSETVEKIVNNLVRKFESMGESEIQTSVIGEEIMNELSKIDLVSYVRFASVYKDFNNAEDFEIFLKHIKNAN